MNSWVCLTVSRVSGCISRTVSSRTCRSSVALPSRARKVRRTRYSRPGMLNVELEQHLRLGAALRQIGREAAAVRPEQRPIDRGRQRRFASAVLADDRDPPVGERQVKLDERAEVPKLQPARVDVSVSW